MKKRMHSSSAISRSVSRAMPSALRNIKRGLLMSSRRFRIVDVGSVPLTRFRQLTHSPKIGRDSSQSGPHFSRVWHTKLHQDLRYLDAKGVERLRQSLPSLTQADMEKICKERRARREVMFAKGVSGGSHRPPTYNFKSLVRC